MAAFSTDGMRRDRSTSAEPDQPVTRQSAPCPVCGQPSVERYRSFCSARCADVDMGRWLSGNYRVETDIAHDEEPGAG